MQDNEINVGRLYLDNSCWEAARISDTIMAETIGFRHGLTSRRYFIYLLMDSKIFYQFEDRLRRFPHTINEGLVLLLLSGCFYVGKGQADRPVDHLREATNHNYKGPKYDKVREIWDMGNGIVVLKSACNSTSYEAATREAILIDFIGLERLTNMRRGCYYGDAIDWSRSMLCNMGSFYIVKIIRESYGDYHRAVLKQDFAK